MYRGVYEISGWDMIEESNEYLSVENLAMIVTEVHQQLGRHILAVVMFEDWDEGEC